MPAARYLAFDDFLFNVPTRELSRIAPDGAQAPVALGCRAADLLLLFLQRPGELVTKNEITHVVWPNVAVEESNLTVQISTLRRALDDGRSKSCIETVPRRGYRFTSQVAELHSLKATVEAPAESPVANDQTIGTQTAASLPVLIAPASPAIFAPAASSSPASSTGHRRTARWSLIAAGIAMLMCATAVVWHWRAAADAQPGDRTDMAGASAVDRTANAERRRLSIVVLPFVNAGGEQKYDALAAALTEDVTTSLVNMNGAFVAASSMAKAVAARKMVLPAIGDQLGVRFVLEGTVRRAPNEVVLTLQLSDAASGANLWTKQVTGAPADPSTKVAQQILPSLRTAFLDAEARRLSGLPAETLSAADLQLQVRASTNHPPSVRHGMPKMSQCSSVPLRSSRIRPT